MKTILLCMMLMLSGMLTAQTVDNPPFKARSGSIGNITRIERTPDGTRVYIHAIFRPHWWIKEEGDSYLEDAATGKKYQFKSAEGIELNKEVYMPDSGEMDYVLVFEALPEETQVIHLLSPSDTEGNTYDISLVPSSGKNVSRKESAVYPAKGSYKDNSCRHRLSAVLPHRYHLSARVHRRLRPPAGIRHRTHLSIQPYHPPGLSDCDSDRRRRQFPVQVCHQASCGTVRHA